MTLYRLFNKKLKHYQYYKGGEEIVEFSNIKKIYSYMNTYKGSYRIDSVDSVTGEIKKDIDRIGRMNPVEVAKAIKNHLTKVNTDKDSEWED